MLAPSSSNSIAANCADPANTIHEDAHPASVLTDSDSRMTTPSAIAKRNRGYGEGQRRSDAGQERGAIERVVSHCPRLLVRVR